MIVVDDFAGQRVAVLGLARSGAAVVRALASRIPGAQLKFFEGGHLFMLEDTSAYPHMTEFLTA